MKEKTATTLRTELCKILDDCAEAGINSDNDLSRVKMALSALQKLVTLETMQCVSSNRGKSEGNSYLRNSRGRYCDDGYSNHGVHEKMQDMLKVATPREREIIEEMMQRL